MAGSHDPGAAVNTEAVVALLRPDRLSCVQAHSHAHLASLRPWVPAQHPLRLGGGLCGGTRSGEDVEERVTLGVDLLAAVARERLAQDASMGGEQLAVQVAQVREQLRRAFDVREQKGDRATLELSRKTSPTLRMSITCRPRPVNVRALLKENRAC